MIGRSFFVNARLRERCRFGTLMPRETFHTRVLQTMDRERFEKLITDAVLEVPPRIRHAMNNVAFVVEDDVRSARGGEVPVPSRPRASWLVSGRSADATRAVLSVGLARQNHYFQKCDRAARWL